jgi:hypothetical protein
MGGLDGAHVVPPTVMSHNNRRAVFSVRGRCRRFITDMAYRLLGLGMWKLGDWKTYECCQCSLVRLGVVQLVQCLRSRR